MLTVSKKANNEKPNENENHLLLNSRLYVAINNICMTNDQLTENISRT